MAFAESLGVPVFTTSDCLLCRKRTRDYYMVHDAVWKSVVSSGTGHLHLSCLEQELGRKLTIDDFIDAPVNDVIRFGYGLTSRSTQVESPMSMNFYVHVPNPEAHPRDFASWDARDEVERIVRWLAQNGCTDLAVRVGNFDHRRPVQDMVLDYDITYNLASIIRRCLGMPDGDSGSAEWAAQCWGSGSISATFDGQRIGDHASRFKAAVVYLREHRAELAPLLPENGWGTMEQVEGLLTALAECAAEHPDGVLSVH